MALTARMAMIDFVEPLGLASFWTEAAGHGLRLQREDRFLILAAAGPEGDDFCVPAPE